MRHPTACLLALTATIPAQDGWRDLTGKPVPYFETVAWLNVDGTAPTLASLRNRVWLLKFTAST